MNAKLSGSFKNAKSLLQKDIYPKISDFFFKKNPKNPLWLGVLLIFGVGFLRVLWVGFFGSGFLCQPCLKANYNGEMCMVLIIF